MSTEEATNLRRMSFIATSQSASTAENRATHLDEAGDSEPQDGGGVTGPAAPFSPPTESPSQYCHNKQQRYETLEVYHQTLYRPSVNNETVIRTFPWNGWAIGLERIHSGISRCLFADV